MSSPKYQLTLLCEFWDIGQDSRNRDTELWTALSPILITPPSLLPPKQRTQLSSVGRGYFQALVLKDYSSNEKGSQIIAQFLL